MKGKVILIISPEKWGDNFVSKHHYAHYLSQENTVYFLNPPEGSQFPLPKGLRPVLNRISDNLHIINYKNPIPKLNALGKRAQGIIYKKLASSLQKEIGVPTLDIVWSFDPYRFWNLAWFSATERIYHTVDLHQAKFEQDCLNSSTISFASSRYLINQFNSSSQLPIYIGHGSHIVNTASSPFITLGKNPLKIGLVGNFYSNNVDLDFLTILVHHLKTTADFILIGPYKKNNLGGNLKEENEVKIKELKLQTNVFFIGETPPNNLLGCIRAIDINLILYKDFTKNISPHKLMTYLQAGSVILSSKIYDLKEFPEHSIIEIKPNEICDVFDKVIKDLSFYNSKELKQRRTKYAMDNSYEARINEIEDHLNRSRIC